MTAETEGGEEEVALTSATTKRMRGDLRQLQADRNSLAVSEGP